MRPQLRERRFLFTKGDSLRQTKNGSCKMNSGTRKILFWIAIPLLIIGFVAWQWVEVAQEKGRVVGDL